MLCGGRKECPKTKPCHIIKNKKVLYKPKYPHIKINLYKNSLATGNSKKIKKIIKKKNLNSNLGIKQQIIRPNNYHSPPTKLKEDFKKCQFYKDIDRLRYKCLKPKTKNRPKAHAMPSLRSYSSSYPWASS